MTRACTLTDHAAARVKPAPLNPKTASAQMALWLTAAAIRLHNWLQSDLPDLTLRHSCLSGYLAAYKSHAPNLAPESWAAHLVSSERIGRDGLAQLPLTRAAETLGLSEAQRLAFCLAALAEEDPRIGGLLMELQGTNAPYPTADTLSRALAGPAPALGTGWDLVKPLLSAGLLTETDPAAPRARRTFAPSALAWDIARGAETPQWPYGVQFRQRQLARKIDDLAYRTEFRDRLRRIPSAIARMDAPVIVLRHIPGADTREIAGAIARTLGRDLLTTPKTDGKDATSSTELEAAALLTGAALFHEVPLAPGETYDLPTPSQARTPVILSLGRSGGLSAQTAERAVSIDVPFPRASERARAWRETFGVQEVEGFNEIRDRFQLPLGHIRRAASAARREAALAGRETIRPEDARAAVRSLGREQLDTMADFLPAKDSWDDLIVPHQTRELLSEFAQRCVHRETLSEQLRLGTAERGVRALFSGPSGTGKTLAARLLGGEIGTDVYRLNLSAVVDKYVGETEKRLDQLLSRAEALDVILLLDEGDGLMAQRTDVRSANDRFANLETNFLLQRLESHAGIVVVTTNMPDGIDPAFQRRMDVVVPFPRPAAEVRLALWTLHLPADHRVSGEELCQLATLATLTGGQIRNAVRTALSLAISDRKAIDGVCLRRGIDLELQKAGAMSGTSQPQANRAATPSVGLPAFGAMLKGGTS